MSDNSNNSFNAKNLFFGVLTAIGASLIVAKLLGGKDEDEEREKRAHISRELIYKKIPPSYPDYTYIDYGNILDTALLRSVDEDEDAVYSIFERMKNVSDVLKTIEGFGTRRQMFSTTYITLPQALSLVFSKREIKKVNDILLKKRIAYEFN